MPAQSRALPRDEVIDVSTINNLSSIIACRVAESESESPEAVVTSPESESELEPTKLH